MSSKTNDWIAFVADNMHELDDLIDFKADKKYGMKSNALKQLRKLTGYNQFRFKCKTQGGTHLLHIKTTLAEKGLEVTDCLTVSNSTTKVFLPACDTFMRMGDDNSTIGKQCQSWNWNNKYGHDRWLISHAVYIPHELHWNLGFYGRYECDSFKLKNPETISNGDFWEVYVR